MITVVRKKSEVPKGRRNILKKKLNKYYDLMYKRDILKNTLFEKFDIYNGERVKGKKYKKMRSIVLNIDNRKLRTVYYKIWGYSVCLQTLKYNEL